MQNNRPSVSIVIVNWNGFEDTSNCLNSLKNVSYTNFIVIVVDNGSDNDESQRLQKKFGSFIHVISTYKNLGFGTGNNIGIRYALEKDCEYILLLNNDTIVSSNFLDPLIDIAENNQHIGAVGPKLLTEDGNIQLDSVARFPSLIDQFYLWSFLYPIGRYIFFRKLFIPKYLMLDFDRESQKSVDMICGACMLLPTSTLKNIGLFDENFFLFAEDMDLCYRIKSAGLNIIYAPQSEVIHLKNKSVQKLSTKHFVEVPLNSYYYYKKNFSRRTAVLFRIIILVCIIPQLIVWGIKTFFKKTTIRNLRTILLLFQEVLLQLLKWKSVSNKADQSKN